MPIEYLDPDIPPAESTATVATPQPRIEYLDAPQDPMQQAVDEASNVTSIQPDENPYQTAALQTAATALRYGGPVVAGLASARLGPGAGLLIDSLAGRFSEQIAQKLEGREDPGAVAAATIPIPRVGQQATFAAQIGKEALAGAVQGMGSTLARSAATGEQPSLVSGVVGSALPAFLNPAMSTAFRAGASVLKQGLSREAAAEFERPFVQQFLSERAAKIKELTGGAVDGLDSKLSSELAHILYSPAMGADTPEAHNAFANEIAQIIKSSIASTTKTGKTGADLSDTIAKALEAHYGAQAAGTVKPAIDAFLGEADAAIAKATDAVDQSLTRNRSLVDKARKAEGRVALAAVPLQQRLQTLKTDLEALGPLQLNEKARLNQEISDLSTRISDIEGGAHPLYPAASSESSFELGTSIKEAANKNKDAFLAESNARYAPVREELEGVTIQTGTVEKDGVQIPVIENVNQLRDKRTKLMKLLDYTKPVQKGSFDTFEAIENLNNQIEEALKPHPDLAARLSAANAHYRQGMEDFKGRFIGSVLRDIGEEGGNAGSFLTSLAGAKGAENLAVLKAGLGDQYDTVKPRVGAFLLRQIHGDNPTQMLESLTNGLTGRGAGIQKEVINEFFPDLSKIQTVAKEYQTAIKDKAAAQSELSKVDSLIADLKASNKGDAAATQAQLDRLNSRRGKIQKVIAEKTSLTGKDLAPEASETVDKLAKIKSDVEFVVKNSGAEGIDNDTIAKALDAHFKGTPLEQAFADAVAAKRKSLDEFNSVFKTALEKGGELRQTDPASLIDFLSSPTRKTPGYKTRQFMDIAKSQDPKLIGDAQDMLLGRMVSESVSDGRINTDKLRGMVKSGGKYAPVYEELFGKSGPEKIRVIADQLDEIQAMPTKSALATILSPMAVGAAAYNIGGLAGLGIAGGAYHLIPKTAMGMRAIEGYNSFVGTVLKNASYRALVSKPYTALEASERALIDRHLPTMVTQSLSRYGQNAAQEER